MRLTQSTTTLDALIDSLQFDPFYAAICHDFRDDATRRRAVLADYFDYSLMEGARSGRLVVWPHPSIGAAAVWLLPVDDADAQAESTAKAAFLAQAMRTHAAEAYYRIVDFMRPRAMAVMDESAWYLSIVGVAPAAQGAGIGARLLQPTLAEADAAGAVLSGDLRRP